MAEAIFPSSYTAATGPGGRYTSTGNLPMVGFHAIKVHDDSNVASLKTTATNKWVWLPMPPAGVSTSYEQGWDKADASAAGSAVSQLLSKLFGKDPESKAPSAPAAGNEGIQSFDTVANAAKMSAMEKIKGKLGAGQGITGRVLEQAFISYSGPGYRNHEFSFSLKPASEADTAEVDKIVTFFKFHSAPELMGTGGLMRLYKVPHLFNIKFMPDDGLFEFMPSALTNIGVSYGGEKYNIFRDTQKPVQTDITLSFKEMRLLDNKHFGDF